MLARIDLRGTPGDLRVALPRSESNSLDVRGVVEEIIADVRGRGGVAGRELTAPLDGDDVAESRVDPAAMTAALERISPGLRAALELARDQIVAWHEAQHERE